MGDLVKTTPYSEITATLELLDRWGVDREHLHRLRGASSFVQQQIANAIIASDENFFTKPSVPAELQPVPKPLWREVSKTAITVNLAYSPGLPFDGALIEKHIGEGWVEIEKRVDGLYIDGRKVQFYLSKRQLNGKWLKGYELREELTSKPVLNANILDALYENTNLIPEDWKRDENGDVCYIFFWATIYRRPVSGRLFVRYLCFDGGLWCRRCNWLDDGVPYPAAVLANKS